MKTEWPYAKEWIVDFATQNLSRSRLTKVLEALKETA
jgi:hypothetical protein